MLEDVLHPISGSESVWASTYKGKKLLRKTWECASTQRLLEKQTLRDNLGLYATLKRVARNQIKNRVDNMIFNLELELIQKQLASTH